MIDDTGPTKKSTVAMSDKGEAGFLVGDWYVMPSICRIRRGDKQVKLEPRVMQVLEFLAQRPNQVVSRSELEKEVWRGRTVGYEALGRTVGLLRKSLGDDTKHPRYIETLSKKGYRLVAPVSLTADISAAVHEEDNKKAGQAGLYLKRRQAVVAVIVLAVAIIGIWGVFWQTPPKINASGPPKSSMPIPIVVLPFNNLSSDPSQSYVADGIADSLITDLTKISGLLVIARHTAFQYRGERWSAASLARELQVRFVLHGSLQREADTLRVNAQLTDAASGSQMWAERYDGTVQDIFGLQDRIARNVVSVLAVNLTESESDQLASRDTVNLESYEYFLRGRERYFRFSREDNRVAREFYLKAIELDPNFARAYAMLALTYRQEVVNGWSDNHEQALDEAMKLAEKTIALDGGIPEAYFVKALVHRERKEYFEAILAAEKAIEIDPDYADGHVAAGSVLYLAGRAAEGLDLVEKAMRLNPHHPHNYQLCQGQALYVMGSYDEAASAFEQGVERYPESERLHLWLAAAYAQVGEAERAKWEIEQVFALNPNFSPSFLEQASPFRYQEDLDKFLDGVRKAMRNAGGELRISGSTSQP